MGKATMLPKKRCCRKEIQTYREMLDLARCEYLHGSNDFIGSNAMRKASKLALRMLPMRRNGELPRAIVKRLCPNLSKSLGYTREV